MSLNECNEGESSDGVSCKYMRFSFRFDADADADVEVDADDDRIYVCICLGLSGHARFRTSEVVGGIC